jgi:hypothetical protein
LKPAKVKTDPSTNFWTVYKKVADEHDNDLVSKYVGDLDTSLLFVSIFASLARLIRLNQILLLCQAGLFSAVTSAFIVQIVPQLQPNPADLTNVLLLRILEQNTSFGGIDPLAPISNVPTGVVRAQSILFASLSVTLFVAFVAVLGKQWILYYTRVSTWGNIVDRGKERQAKLMGLQKWGLHLIMESLPVMLQFALLLFGIALAVYLWDLNVSAAGSGVGGHFDRHYLLHMHHRGRDDLERLSVPDTLIRSTPEGPAVGEGIHPACSCLVEELVEAKDHPAPAPDRTGDRGRLPGELHLGVCSGNSPVGRIPQTMLAKIRLTTTL